MTNPKHAYLIMAHANWSILTKLLRLLDDPRHDIYLHIDVKSARYFDVDQIFLYHSRLTVIEPRRVYWADYSQTDTELRLMKTAAQQKYSYYHLLSGVDLPLKTNDERYRFYEESGKNFIGIVPHESYYSVRRVKYFHPFTHFPLYRNCKLLKAADRLFEYAQRGIGINRLRSTKWKIIDGWTWFSIRHDLCMKLIHSEERIKKMFCSSIASDELFIQTFVYNTQGFRETLYDETDLKRGSMRNIDWERGKPYTWRNTEDDYLLLINSLYMFVRKFSEEKSGALVDRIYKEIMEKQKK